MRVNAPNEPLAAISHPNIDNVRANVHLARRSERVPQIILRNCFVLYNPLEYAVKYIRSMLFPKSKPPPVFLARLFSQSLARMRPKG